MAMKGTIKPGHIPANNYQLMVVGLPALTPTAVSGLDTELETANLPDRTVASGGNTKAADITIKLPMHHVVEQRAMEKWFQDSQDPVKPGYKKPATLCFINIEGKVTRAFSLIGVFPKKRKLPDMDLANAGDMTVAEWTLAVDDVQPS